MKKPWNKLELTGKRFAELVVLAEENKSCGSCGKIAHNRGGHEDRNMVLQVTLEEVWKIFMAQDRCCAISGVELKFAITGSYWSRVKKNARSRNYIKNPHEQTASLDRIDSNKGYVPSNIQWVHKVVNIMKNTLSDDLLEWCKTIVNFNE